MASANVRGCPHLGKVRQLLEEVEEEQLEKKKDRMIQELAPEISTPKIEELEDD